MTALEVAAAVQRELGIVIVSSPCELPAGYVVREFWCEDPSDRSDQPLRVVRPATPDEVERQCRLIDRLTGIPLTPGAPPGLHYVVEAD